MLDALKKAAEELGITPDMECPNELATTILAAIAEAESQEIDLSGTELNLSANVAPELLKALIVAHDLLDKVQKIIIRAIAKVHPDSES